MKLTEELCPEMHMFVRCDPAALLAAGTSAATLLEELQDMGFDCAVIDEASGELSPAGAWLWDSRTAVDLHCARIAA